MGRFAWTQNHHKQPSDGRHGLPEWFSKHTGEPSRQAITDLMKEHKATSPPSTTRTRSRANTLVSTPSLGHKSTSSQSSSSLKSRPASRQNSIDHVHRSPDSHDTSSKNLLSKGSKMVRRQTSMFNVLASQLNDHTAGHDNPTWPHSIQRVKSAGQALSRHTKRATMRPQISGPFDFQHVAHTNQSQYQTLKEVNTVDLAESFNALQADQQPQDDIRGIPVADLQSETPDCVTRPSSPAFSIVASLDEGASKPLPPPKDHLRLPSLGGNVRMSQSIENFSYPNRTSPLPEIDGGNFSSFGDDAASAPVTAPTSFSEEEYPFTFQSTQVPPQLAPSPMLDKPLPQAPTLVHAVSTSDLSTLFLKTSPLPEPPQHQKKKSTDTNVCSPASKVSSHRSSIRHMQSVPADLGLRRSSQFQTGTISRNTFLLPSEVLASPPRPTPPEKRISVGLKTIDVDDWEDAIDDAWDHALDDEDEDEDVMEMNAGMSKSDILPQKSFASLNATGPCDTVSALSMRHHTSEISLRGLGLGQPNRYSAMFNPDFDVHVAQRESLRVPYPQRISGSPISKSSSQESIILSIASSIMSTHRSSNSSTSFGDLKHLSQIEDEDMLHHKVSNGGSTSSTETVTTDQKSIPSTEQVEEDILVDLPTLNHQRGASTSRIPYVPNRRSSMTPAAKAVVRQRSSTLSGQPRLISRGSYSLFPVASQT